MTEWAAFSASIVNVFAGIAVVGAAIIYYRQLQAMKTARELESLVVIMKYVDDISLRRARYFMLEHSEKLVSLFDLPYSWDSRRAVEERVRELSGGKSDLHEIDLAVNALNNVCFLIREGYAPPAAQAFLRNSLLHAWRAFESYVQYRRSRPDTIGGPSRYGAHLEAVVKTLTEQPAVA